MKIQLMLCLVWAAAVLFPGCSGEQPPSENRFGETGPVTSAGSDPLTHAMQILGLREIDLQRPAAVTEDYRALARLPLVDHLSQSHFHLQQWAERTSKNLQDAAETGVATVFPTAVGIINGGVVYRKQNPASGLTGPGLVDALDYLFNQYHDKPDAAVTGQIDRAGLSKVFEHELARLVTTLADAAMMASHAIADLSAEEVSLLTQEPHRYMYPDGLTFNFLTAPTHTQTKLLAIAQKIDFTKMFTAASLICSAVDDFIRNLPNSGGPGQYFQDGKLRQGFLLDIPTPLGSIILAGPGKDIHFRTGALLVDLGGNDTYRFREDDGPLPFLPVSVTVDLEGNDVHGSAGDRAVQGFGNLSVGMLVDRQGDDRYQAGDMAQGCGMFGVGILADYQGNDRYEMGVMGQGFGLFGVGVLLDRRGNDRYTVTGLGQGAGTTMATGILCDAGGSDKYLADRSRRRGQLPPDDWSHVQGVGLSVRSPDWGRQASLYGGVGFLSDGGGDDFYFSSHENCMGASYFLSIGALVDHGGSDWYIPEKGLGIGFAIHLGSAVFVDYRGDDRYFGNLLSGGAASDRSIAIMVDYGGDDVYGPTQEYTHALVVEEAKKNRQQLSADEAAHRTLRRLAQNAFASARKPKAFGMLIDHGGNDRYTSRPDEFGQSFGGLLPPAAPQDWSHALLFDLGGQDTYSHSGRKNNRFFKSMGHGLCYDTETDISVFGKNRVPADRESKKVVLPNVDVLHTGQAVDRDILQLGDADVFRRFTARDRIVARSDPAVVNMLLRVLNDSTDEAFNQEILEIVDALLFAGTIKEKTRDVLLTLLDAREPSVRIFAAGKLGRWKIRSALKPLIRKGNDPQESVRIQIIRAVGRISAGDAVDFLLKAGSSDPSLACRREAFLALGTLATASRSSQTAIAENLPTALIQALDEPDEVIRTAAAASLVCCVRAKGVKAALENRLQDPSAYVQRAAAKSLIFNGVKAGIPALIDTLQFPSIDTRHHYDRELAVDLAFFCGVDFGPDKRYSHTTWKNWWANNKEKVDLEQNLTIRSQIERAFSEPSELAGIAIFEDLQRRYPNNEVVRHRLVRFCRDWITMRLLTGKTVDREVILRSIRLQKILTEVQPEVAEHWVGLAYFHYRLGSFQLALEGMETALRFDPDNVSYREKRDAYRVLLQQTEQATR